MSLTTMSAGSSVPSASRTPVTVPPAVVTATTSALVRTLIFRSLARCTSASANAPKPPSIVQRPKVRSRYDQTPTYPGVSFASDPPCAAK